MSRILITSGPTREYFDPVRYLSNASSGRMGAALASAAIERGHEVVIVSGPVEVQYPAKAEVVPVISTEEMLSACQKLFPAFDGLIAVAAPCDYRPKSVEPHKIHKSGSPLSLELVETPDIVATLSTDKKASQWIVAFALETQDQHLRAMQKLDRKRCDLIVVNGPDAIHAENSQVEILGKDGRSLGRFLGKKIYVAKYIFVHIERELLQPL
jgi:phosphopantothenoylcysteine decarboxylase / phosphopantothenate---cysteine ligase